MKIIKIYPPPEKNEAINVKILVKGTDYEISIACDNYHSGSENLHKQDIRVFQRDNDLTHLLEGKFSIYDTSFENISSIYFHLLNK